MCFDSWGRKESDTTEQLNFTEKKLIAMVVKERKGKCRMKASNVRVPELSRKGALSGKRD